MSQHTHYNCPTLQTMQTLAAQLVQKWQPGDIITLSGNLGTGKTTLVQAMLHALGYQGKVKSPTFTLVEPYTINEQEIYHFDLYRLASPDELEMIGFHDYLTPNSICLIEWPEKAGNALQHVNWHIEITVVNGERIVSLSKPIA